MSLKLLLKLLTYNYLLSLKNTWFTKTKREFTSLDTIPGVAEFVLRRETVRWYETVLLITQHQWYRGILRGTRSGEYGNPRVLVLYQGK